MKLAVSLSELCDEPNPLGDEILFFSSDGTQSYDKLLELNKKKRKIGNEFDGTNEFYTLGNQENDSRSNDAESGVLSERVEENKSVLKQRQKYLLTYRAEADQLATECADALRMQSQIGDVTL